MARDGTDGFRQGTKQNAEQQEAVKRRIKELYKRCHSNALGDIAAIKTDVDKISALLNECRDATTAGNSRAWSRDFGFKIGEPIFLVGKTLDGRIIKSNDPFSIPQSPERFIEALEAFLDRDLSKTGSESQPSGAHKHKDKEPGVGAGTSVTSEGLTGGRQGDTSEDTDESEEIWWGFGRYSPEQRRVLDSMFKSNTIEDLARIPVGLWKDDEGMQKQFYWQANRIFYHKVEEAESARQLINIHNEIELFKDQFLQYHKESSRNPYRDPIAPPFEWHAFSETNHTLIEKVNGFVSEYIQEAKTIPALSALGRELDKLEWLSYHRDELRDQIARRVRTMQGFKQ